jgi:hypothetical protein
MHVERNGKTFEINVNHDDLINGYGISAETVTNIIDAIIELDLFEVEITTQLVEGWICCELSQDYARRAKEKESTGRGRSEAQAGT